MCSMTRTDNTEDVYVQQVGYNRGTCGGGGGEFPYFEFSLFEIS